MSTFSFSLQSPTRFGPRLGSVVLKRPSIDIEIATPGLLATTSRGAVPHLSRDHVRISDAIRWVNVSFETFLEHNPPIPTLQALQPGTSSASNPLHTFLGFTPNKHIVSMSARDPHDGRDMPPNGNAHVSVQSLRGVRKLSPTDWRSYVQACQPDIVFALSDTPFTDPQYSQKRLTKSIERSAAWLSSLLNLKSPPPPPKTSTKKVVNNTSSNVDTLIPTNTRIPPVFLHLAGIASPGARKAFSDSLLEPLSGPEAEALLPLSKLDDGVAGYTIDLVPLKSSVEATSTGVESQIVPLLVTSLSALPIPKPRLITATQSPHEILRYIGSVGVDLFDAGWVQKAADYGVALDFEFPVRRTSGLREIGHNLYDVRYRMDFGALADALRGTLSPQEDIEDKPVCPCAACSPVSPSTRIFHGHDTPLVSGEEEQSSPRHLPHYTRAYIHHLLHTHEMSAHALLVLHNLAVLDAFFAGVRGVIKDGEARWEEEVGRFGEVYDARLGVVEEARERWREVDLARGKGRLARERSKQVDVGAEAVVGVEVRIEV
ncbi:tRNA-guanine transglycosylase [Pholiota conissans]|uniref:tRNA-guanine transglycosylase n=1 Tax=Pholiota conissans TaxID=109636 RepID=A0A9P5YSR6_9AGAR|nr:tRNA-guanine transglycosylase [Pholiota conissans]